MRKLLICEDEPGLLEVLKNRFEEEGWDVTTALDGELALAAITKERFDLVLLDLLMPKKTGFEVLQEVKSNPIYKDLPIIVLSSLGMDEDIKKALALGASDYYVKSQHPIGEILEKAKAFEGGHATPLK